MELKLQNCCQTCGGTLTRISDTQWKCDFCKNIHNDVTVQKHVEELRDLIDGAKMEKLSNLRRNLYNALKAQYLSNREITGICLSIKEMLPDDFQANFYYDACTLSGREIASRIGGINVAENSDIIEEIVNFLLRSVQEEFLLDLADLIERAFKSTNSLEKYAEYSTRFSEEAEKVQSGIYETSLPRDVFVAYSSKDMETVKKLVGELEDSGISCFVAARNLRHGKGSVENYNKALCEAMDNCKSFVFVSSRSSRSFTCDALRIEIPYVMGKDIANAPGNLRNNYSAIPKQYKKCRVEYRIEESLGSNPADRKISEFFDGYERVYTTDEVAMRVSEHIMYVPEFESTPAARSAPTETKICVGCGAQVPVSARFCGECGKDEFVNSVAELIQFNNRKAEQERAEREAAEAAKREQEAKARREREAAENQRKEASAAQSFMFTTGKCKACGGDAEHIFDGHYKCPFCASAFSDRTATTPFPSSEEIYNRAMNYYNGTGVAKNLNESARLMQISADMGYAAAQNNLGAFYENGYGVAKNFEKSFYWYQKSARQNYALGLNNLGVCYSKGRGVAADQSEAVRLFHLAADQGNALAQNNLGSCYEKGLGVGKDMFESVKWYRKAAEGGNATAQCNLAICYINGNGVAKDFYEAVKWLKLSVAQGNAAAQCALGLRYYNGEGVPKDLNESARLFRLSADQGYALAQSNLGSCYEHGHGIAQDAFEAVRWYRKAAENGNATAQNNLALCYVNGKGVVKDFCEAVKWLNLSVAQGNAAAQCTLGLRYFNGEGVPKDVNEAVRLFRLSANQGYSYGENNLGYCYDAGIGVPQDKQMAIELYRRAAAKGNPLSQNALKKLGIN